MEALRPLRRDVAHKRRLVEEGRELPVNVKDANLYFSMLIIRPLRMTSFLKWYL